MIQQNLPYNVYLGLINASSPSAVNPYVTTSALTAGYVPYTGATANLNLGLFSVAAATAQVGAGINSGEALEVFQGLSSVKIGSLVGTPTAAAIYLNQPTPSGSNYTILDDTASLYINGRANNSLYLQIGNFNRVRYAPSYEIHTTAATSSGAVTAYTFDISTNTNQTANTAIPGYVFNPGTRSWITANITNQKEFVISSPTYAASNPSSISNAYTFFVTAPIAGANVSINNNFALGTDGRISVKGSSSDLIDVGTNDGGFYNIKLGYNGVIGSTTGATQLGNLGANALGYYLPCNASGQSVLANTWATGKITYQAYQHNFTFFSSALQAAEYSRLLISGGQVTFSAPIATQRFVYLTSPIVAFNAPNTLTNSYGLYVEAATAGTNATITNNYAAGFSGAIQVTNNTTAIDDFTGGVSGPKRLRLRNSVGSATSFAQIDAENNGSIISSFGITSGAYVGGGVLTANTHFFIAQNGTAGNNILYGANSVAMRIKFINGGFATTNVAFEIDNNNNIICGNAALNTTATDGFLYVPSCAGTPTGVPTTVTGRIPIVADSTNNKLYMYSGGSWVALN